MAKPSVRLFLREWRKKKGWSQQRLAEALDTTKATISRIENQKQNWDSAFLERAALELNTTPADLLRRGPDDPESIELTGLKPDQVHVVHGVVDNMRRAG